MTQKQNNKNEESISLNSIAGASGASFDTIVKDIKELGELRLADIKSYKDKVIADYRGKGKHLFFVQGKTRNWSVGATSLKRLEKETGMQAVMDKSLLDKFLNSKHIVLYRNAKTE